VPTVARSTHYEVLGVGASATTAEIRDAYRRLARQHHPDAAAGDQHSMSAINEAYRVLQDPARRAVYDASLRRSGDAGVSGPTTGSAAAPPTDAPAHVSSPRLLTPVRFPWRAVVFFSVLAVIGFAALSLFSEPAAPPGPDGIIRVGDCVTVGADGFARDAVCGEDPSDDDLVVQALVPLDGTCPFGTSGYQDRQGLGVACVRATPTTADDA
jgi:hypothetical protein